MTDAERKAKEQELYRQAEEAGAYIQREADQTSEALLAIAADLDAPDLIL